MTVKLGRNYVILKKINAYWLLGTITYKTYKVAVPTMVNVFKHKPKHTDGYFLIGDKELSLTSFSFKEKIIFFSLPFGLIKKILP